MAKPELFKDDLLITVTISECPDSSALAGVHFYVPKPLIKRWATSGDASSFWDLYGIPYIENALMGVMKGTLSADEFQALAESITTFTDSQKMNIGDVWECPNGSLATCTGVNPYRFDFTAPTKEPAAWHDNQIR